MNKQETIQLLSECCESCYGNKEPKYFKVEDGIIFFINGCPSSFDERYDGTWVNTTSVKGGFSIHTKDKGFSCLEINCTVDEVVFDKKNNRISVTVSGKKNHKKIKVEPKQFDLILQTLPDMLNKADYYNYVENIDENVVRFVLTKKEK